MSVAVTFRENGAVIRYRFPPRAAGEDASGFNQTRRVMVALYQTANDTTAIGMDKASGMVTVSGVHGHEQRRRAARLRAQLLRYVGGGPTGDVVISPFSTDVGINSISVAVPVRVVAAPVTLVGASGARCCPNMTRVRLRVTCLRSRTPPQVYFVFVPVYTPV